MYNYLGVHQYGLDIDNVIEFMQYQERVKNNVAVVKHTHPPPFLVRVESHDIKEI